MACASLSTQYGKMEGSHLPYLKQVRERERESWERERERERERREGEGVTKETAGVKREERKKRPIVIPYIRGVSKELRRIFGGFGVWAYFNPRKALRQLLVHLKDSVGTDTVVGSVSKISCQNCEVTYTRETECSLRAWFLHQGSQGISIRTGLTIPSRCVRPTYCL